MPSMRWPLSRISPLVGAEAAADEVEQRRLAGAVRADDRDALAGCTARSVPRMISVLPKLLRRSLQLDGARHGAHVGCSPRAALPRRLESRPRSRPGSRPTRARSGAARTRTAPTPISSTTQPRRASSTRSCVSSVRPRKRSVEPSAAFELQVIDHLDQRGRADQQHQRRRPSAPTYQRQSRRELAERGDAQVHHDQAGDAARRVHHHEQEDQAEVEQPGLGELGQQRRTRAPSAPRR